MEAAGFQRRKIAPVRILIVENESAVALDLAATLEGLGYDVAGSVPSGEAAIEQVLAMRPSLVLMDIRLAGKIDGIQAACEIRKQSNIPIIFLSSHADESRLNQARSTEPSGHLVKPFTSVELRSAMEVALHMHQVEDRLRQSEERYRHLVESSIALICTHDLQGNLLFINQAAAGSLGYTAEECLGRNIEEILTPMTKSSFIDYLMKIQEDHTATGKMKLLDKAGRERVWFFSNSLIQNANGDRYVLGHAQDITQMMEMQRAFREVHQAALETEKRLSRTDSLTGLANCRAFHEAAEMERKRCARYARPFAVVHIDLDNFKKLNDDEGHAVGDRVLACVAEVFHKRKRAECVAARLGGDEFALLLPEAGHAEAEHAARNLHNWLKTAMQENNWPVTFSVGVVAFVTPPESVDQMAHMVDEAMYSAKHGGKNDVATVVVAREPSQLIQ